MADLRERYRSQRKSAAKRGIAWEFTFESWLGAWQASGHLDERGRGPGYVMARHGDVGPYSPDNVYFVQGGRNVRDYYATHKERHRVLVTRATRERALRTARGWTFIKKKTGRPYQVMYGDRYVGCFATQAEAEAAHRAEVLKRLADG